MHNVIDLLRKTHEPKKASSTKGGEYHSPCPGCGGDDRFHVWPEENSGEGSWWCRQCGKGGDAIQFLIDFEGMTYPEACKYLGREPRDMPKNQGPKWKANGTGGKVMWKPEPDQGPPPEEWMEKARKFVFWSFENLMNMKDGEGVKGWLAKRGITEPAIKHFWLGWNPGQDGKDIFRPRESWGLPTEIKENGQKKKLWLPIGLVIPLLVDQRIHRLRIRRETGEPRYYVIPGSSMNCLVTGGAGCMAYTVVESELDAVMLHYAVKLPGVTTGGIALGNSSRKPDAKTAALLRNASVILNALDYDKSGADQGQWWTENFPRTIRWPAPVGKDPGEAYEQGMDMAGWIKAGLPKGWFL